MKWSSLAEVTLGRPCSANLQLLPNSLNQWSIRVTNDWFIPKVMATCLWDKPSPKSISALTVIYSGLYLSYKKFVIKQNFQKKIKNFNRMQHDIRYYTVGSYLFTLEVRKIKAIPFKSNKIVNTEIEKTRWCANFVQKFRNYINKTNYIDIVRFQSSILPLAVLLQSNIRIDSTNYTKIKDFSFSVFSFF